jgi:hypothetical protein
VKSKNKKISESNDLDPEKQEKHLLDSSERTRSAILKRILAQLTQNAFAAAIGAIGLSVFWAAGTPNIWAQSFIESFFLLIIIQNIAWLGFNLWACGGSDHLFVDLLLADRTPLFLAALVLLPPIYILCLMGRLDFGTFRGVWVGIIFAPSLWRAWRMRQKSVGIGNAPWKIVPYLVALLIQLAIMASLRLPLISRGLPYAHTWDEPQTMSAAVEMMQTGNLNPHFFQYPSANIDLQYACLNFSVPWARKHGLLNSAADIRTDKDTGWHWTISHPDLWWWGRLCNQFVSLLSVILVFDIGRRLRSAGAGILAAGLFGFNSFVADQASWMAVDTTACFSICAFAWALTVHSQNRSLAWLGLTSIFAGVAISSKYNLVPVLIPLFWACSASDLAEPVFRRISVCLGLVWVGFIAITPYALFDFKNFVDGMIFEWRHYHELGHQGMAFLRPWESFLAHLNGLWQAWDQQLLLALSLVLGLGILAKSIWRRKLDPLLLQLVFPLLFVLFMSRMGVYFPRNSLPLFPYAAILSACTVFDLGNLLAPWVGEISVLVFTAWISLAPAKIAVNQGFSLDRRGHESRSLACIWASEQLPVNKKGVIDVFVSAELKMHAEDVARLGSRAEIANLDQARMSKFQFAIVPSQLQGWDDSVVVAEHKFESRGRLLAAFGNGCTPKDVYAVDPSVEILDLRR